jgi:hypothetical protein
MKVNQVQTQKVNNQGMETFLTPSPSQKTNSQPQPQMEKTKPQNDKFEEIEQPKPKEEIEYKIEEIERELKIKATLDLTTFNNIAHNKQLLFKLLFIRQKIYLHVKDNNGRSAIIAVNLPRWGGTSLRYLVSNCADGWCKVIEKKTNKGTILSYSPLSTSSSNNSDSDIEDIFD